MNENKLSKLNSNSDDFFETLTNAVEETQKILEKDNSALAQLMLEERRLNKQKQDLIDNIEHSVNMLTWAEAQLQNILNEKAVSNFQPK